MNYPRFSLRWSWSLCLAWTSMIAYLLLWPAKGTAVQRISLFFGGSDITDAMGHLFLIFIESNLVYSLLRHYLPESLALRYSIMASLTFAFILETAQLFIPGRGAALIDFLANALGVALFALVLRFFPKSPSD